MSIEKEYKEKYGNIPKDVNDRLSLLINKLKLKRKSKKDIFKSINDINNIKWNNYKFNIYLLPKSTPRPRANTIRGIFYVKGAKVNKSIFKKFIKDNPYPIIITPMIFTINVYLPTPNSFTIVDKIIAEYGFIRPITKPDFDNVAKTYADMIQDSLIYDDNLIIESHIYKYYSIKPRIEISIDYMEEYDCEYNKALVYKRLK